MKIKYELERKYNLKKFEISELELKLASVDDDIMPSLTPNYSGMPTGKGGTSDKVFDTVSKLQTTKEQLAQTIATKKAEIKMLDNLINTQSYKAQRIIKARALEGKDFYIITKEVQDDTEIYNVEYCKKLYYKALKDMQRIYDSMEKNI